MNAETALDEVTDLIANIEMHRQEIEKEAGLEASRNYALRRLRQALALEQEQSKLQGPGVERLANTEALAAEIRRVETLAGIASRRPTLKRASPGPLRETSGETQRKRPGSRGRRTMGRHTNR